MNADGDTDSEPGNSGSETQWHMLSEKEIVSLQDQLQAAKMRNEELYRLLQERHEQNQVVVGQAPPSSGISKLNTSSAAAFGRSLSTQMKVGTGAISVLGARSVASLQSTLAKKGLLSGSDHAVPAPANSGEAQAQGGLEEGLRTKIEQLHNEAEQLRSRVQATLEEATEFQNVADEAWKVVAAATPEKPLPEEKGANVVLPSIQELRAAFAAQTDALGAGGELEDFDDGILLCVADAALRLQYEHYVGARAQGASAPELCPPESDVDEDWLLLQRKIDAQQQELDRLKEIFEKQQEQIIRLRDKLQDPEVIGKDDKKSINEKIKETEKKVEEVSRKLEDSEELSRQTQEMRRQLRAFAEQLVERDTLVAEMKSRLEMEETSSAVLRERLALVSEDILGHIHQQAVGRRAQVSPAVAPGVLHTPSAASNSVPAKCSLLGTAMVAESTELAVTKETSVQAELDPGLAAYRTHQALATQLEDLRIEKVLLEKRTSRELHELRNLYRDLDRRHSAKEIITPLSGTGNNDQPLEAITEEGEVRHHDISSDSESGAVSKRGHRQTSSSDRSPSPNEAYSAGFVFVQRVEELEERNESLRQQLGALHESERSLRNNNKEKNDLIAHLMRRANLPGHENVNLAAAQDGIRFWQRNRQTEQERDCAHLQCMIDETNEDNVRLRNDIQTLAEELRKALTPSKLPH